MGLSTVSGGLVTYPSPSFFQPAPPPATPDLDRLIRKCSGCGNTIILSAPEMFHKAGCAALAPCPFPKNISDKDVYKELAGRLAFGNQFRIWPTYGKFITSGYRGWVTIRSWVRDSPFFVPEVRRTAIGPTVSRLLKQGARLENLYFQEIPSPGENLRVMNFEIGRGWDHIWLRFGFGQKNLRHDLDESGWHAKGMEAYDFLNQYVSPESRETIQAIFDNHPDCMIEATEWSQPLGMLDQNLIVWEVRNY